MWRLEMTSWFPAVLDGQQEGGWVLVHHSQHFLAMGEGVLLPRNWLKEQALPVIAEHGLGRFRGQPLHLLELEYKTELQNGSWVALRQFMLAGDAELCAVLGYAAQIGTWASTNRFCGHCGAALQRVTGERAMQCARCQLRQYPRLSPSMIVLVTRGDEILLARSTRFATGVYSALAGFVEPGESVEQCVVREVFEEVGVEITDIHYQGSQNWPFPHSLMLGFHARYRSGTIRCQPEEIEDADWFSIRRLPPLPSSLSIARYLIDLYVARRLGQGEPVLPG
jgi:NAD+ diphosphatase